VIIVSGDGDFKNLVEFLLRENKFLKILFPNKFRRSSLYKDIGNNHFSNLDDVDVRNKIEKIKQAK
jgi:hypothetical protein